MQPAAIIDFHDPEGSAAAVLYQVLGPSTGGLDEADAEASSSSFTSSSNSESSASDVKARCMRLNL